MVYTEPWVSRFIFTVDKRRLVARGRRAPYLGISRFIFTVGSRFHEDA
jgi:hypothetical protein